MGTHPGNDPTLPGRSRVPAARRVYGVAPVLLFTLILLPVPPPFGGGGHVSPPPKGSYALYPPAPAPNATPIQHIVIVMQENHAYDNYFGTYCRNYGTYCSFVGNGTPSGVCLPLYLAYPKVGCDRPWRFPNASSMFRDIVHDKYSSVAAYDNGSNDGFVPAETSGNLTMGYWDAHALGDYWQVAEQYALGDNFFSSAMSYSLANHWYLLAGAAPQVGIDEYVSPTPTFHPNWTQESLYLNQSNATIALDDLLVNSSLSWNYYDFSLPKTYQNALNGSQAFAYWNPLAAKAETYQTALSSHFVPRNRFLNDSASGNLPNVSWVIPSIPLSEHPPYNVTTGEQWVMNVTNAVEHSPEWNSTVMFITWDEYGGFYDSVPPPKVDGVGLSFRVPVLVVSPYVRENYIAHQMGDFESLLKLVEWRYGLGHLTQRDLNATLPLRALDFNATPRAPLTFGPAQGATYPVGLQPLPAPPAPGNVTTRPGSTTITLRWTPPVGGTAPSFYRLSYYPKGSPFAKMLRIDGAANGYVLTGLGSNTTYFLSLASAAGGNLSTLTYVHATTLPPIGSLPYRPNAPPSGSTPLFIARPALVVDPEVPQGPRPARG